MTCVGAWAFMPFNGGSHFTLLDAADYEWAGQYRWSLSKSTNDDVGYVRRYGPRAEKSRRTFLLHRQILGLRPGDQTP
jgi:hypothetical protein